MSDPIRISITTAQEILGPEFSLFDNGDQILSAGDVVTNFQIPLKDQKVDIVAQQDGDLFFSLSTPDKFLNFLGSGKNKVSLATSEFGGKVFLVVAEKSEVQKIKSIYEIGDYIKVKDQYIDLEKDLKVDLNTAEASTATQLKFDRATLEQACVSKKDPRLVVKQCLVDLNDYENATDTLTQKATEVLQSQRVMTSAHSEQTLSRNEIEDFRQKLMDFRRSLLSYQQSAQDFVKKYQHNQKKPPIRIKAKTDKK